MLDIDLIRTNKTKVEEALLKRMSTVNLDEIIELDKEKRETLRKLEGARFERKKIAESVEVFRKKSLSTVDLEIQASEVKSKILAFEETLLKISEELNNRMLNLPNIPDDRVPSGGKEANQCIKTWGKKPELGEDALDHVELCNKYGLVDFERGVKLGGSGHWLYCGEGAALEWALLNYFCQKHYKDGYKFFLPPHLLTRECGIAAGQFPKFYDDVYHLQSREGSQDKFLLPTAETALLNIYRDEILPEDSLPIKIFGYTPCYRREAGGARADERGTVRGHQFNKVEMFQFVKAEDAETALQELIARTENILEELGLHYRTVLLAAEDTSTSMALTYDVEVWIPSIGAYKEVSSVSWAGDFQARRAKIRYKPKNSKKAVLVHTLNASGLATSRLLPAILEQNQNSDHSINIPPPLRQWLGCNKIG